MRHTPLKPILAATLRLSLLIALLASASCAVPDRTDAVDGRGMWADPSLSAAENLQRLAGREQQAKNLRSINAPIPPGIEPEALAARSTSDERAFLSLESALHKLVVSHHPETETDQPATTGNGEAKSNGADDADTADTRDADEPDADADDDESDPESEAIRHYVRGRQAMLEDRMYVAITELQRAAQLDPDSPRIRRELARAYTAMNNQSRAMEQYTALRQLVPDDAEAIFSLGLNAANRREFETAAAILGRRLLDDEPFDHDPAADVLARYTIAFSLRHLGYDRAFVQLWTLEATEPAMTGELFERTMYAARLGSIYRQRAEIWRSIGDARCRLGEFTPALDAYAISAALPSPDPAALHPRVIYANLRLGRVYSAQYELLAALNNDDGTISERNIRLCAYLADVVADDAARGERMQTGDWQVRLLGEHMRARYDRSPDDSGLARAAAALLPPDEARRVLREFVDRRPRDLDVVGSLLAWLGSRDLNAAIVLTVDVVAANPDLAAQYVNRLAFAVPDPVKVLEALDEHLPFGQRDGGRASDAHHLALVNVKARVLATLGAPGEAWQLVHQYRPAALGRIGDMNINPAGGKPSSWQRNAKGLALLRLDLVAQLEEPSLITPVLAEIAPETAGDVFDSTRSWVARARLLRRFSRFDEAMDAAERAMAVAERQMEAGDRDPSLLVLALLEQARTYSRYADSFDQDAERARWAEESAYVAERLLDDLAGPADDGESHLTPAEIDSAFEVILTTYGPNGILHNAQQFRDAARRLYERNPDSRLYVRMMAEEAVSQGRYDLALERAMNLYDSHPHETGAIELAMLVWSRMEQPDGLMKAREWLTERLSRRPGDPALLEQWVQAGLRLDRVGETIHALREALDNRPRHVTAQRLLESAYRATGRTDLAFPLGEERLLNRPQGVRREVELAALYGGAGMERETLNRLQWLLENLDDAGYDHLLTAIAILGRLESTGVQHDEMTLALARHMVLDRSARAPLQVYGAALRSLGRQGRVDDQLFGVLVEQAARHAIGAGASMDSAMQWRNLAQALIDDDLADTAAAAVRGRVEADAPLEPNALSFLTNIALIADAAHGGAEQAEESIAFLERLAKRNRLPVLFGMDYPPTLADALYQTSSTYSIVGDLAGAKRVLEAVVAIEPDNAMALNNLGYLRVEAEHDDEQTTRWIERAFELESEDSHILDTIGWLRYKQGRFEDEADERGALSLIEESAERAEAPSAEVHDHLGDVLWRLGQHDEAAEAWKMAERILADPARREEMVRNYGLIQSRAWGLVVADPEAMYDRDFGEMLITVREKLEAANAGEEPRVAPTFAELRGDE